MDYSNNGIVYYVLSKDDHSLLVSPNRHEAFLKVEELRSKNKKCSMKRKNIKRIYYDGRVAIWG